MAHMKSERGAGRKDNLHQTVIPRVVIIEIICLNRAPERRITTSIMKISGPVSALVHSKPHTLWSIAPDALVFEGIKLMAEKNVGALLVMAGDQLMGVFTERDYTRKVALQGKSSKETRVREILSPKVVTVGPHQTVEECMRLMTEHR